MTNPFLFSASGRRAAKAAAREANQTPVVTDPEMGKYQVKSEPADATGVSSGPSGPSAPLLPPVDLPNIDFKAGKKPMWGKK